MPCSRGCAASTARCPDSSSRRARRAACGASTPLSATPCFTSSSKQGSSVGARRPVGRGPPGGAAARGGPPEGEKMTSHKPLSGLRIGVFGKGGAGKSTVTVLLAQALRARGHPVLVVDADSTNVGLAGALGIQREPEPLLQYFGGAVFSGGRGTC